MLIAIDPSLTASGWALFDLENGQPLALGLISPPGPEANLSRRLEELQREVSSLFLELALGAGDILVCEGPAPLVLNPDSAVKVEQVRSIFESVARTSRMLVPGRINPRTVQTEILSIKGRQLERRVVKACAREAVKKLYGPLLPGLKIRCASRRKKGTLPQDIVDALLIGSLAVSRCQLARKLALEVDSLFDVRKQERVSIGKRRSRWTEKDLKKLGGLS